MCCVCLIYCDLAWIAKWSKFAYDQNTAIHDMLLTNADSTEKVRLRQQTDSRYVQKGHRKAIREWRFYHHSYHKVGFIFRLIRRISFQSITNSLSSLTTNDFYLIEASVFASGELAVSQFSSFKIVIYIYLGLCRRSDKLVLWRLIFFTAGQLFLKFLFSPPNSTNSERSPLFSPNSYEWCGPHWKQIFSREEKYRSVWSSVASRADSLRLVTRSSPRSGAGTRDKSEIIPFAAFRKSLKIYCLIKVENSHCLPYLAQNRHNSMISQGVLTQWQAQGRNTFYDLIKNHYCEKYACIKRCWKEQNKDRLFNEPNSQISKAYLVSCLEWQYVKCHTIE